MSLLEILTSDLTAEEYDELLEHIDKFNSICKENGLNIRPNRLRNGSLSSLIEQIKDQTKKLKKCIKKFKKLTDPAFIANYCNSSEEPITVNKFCNIVDQALENDEGYQEKRKITIVVIIIVIVLIIAAIVTCIILHIKKKKQIIKDDSS